MSGVLTLTNNDLLILRDVASQYYLQAGQDSDAMNSVAKLISGNLGMLQPSLFFQVHSTPITGFWMITTVATGKWLKVDTSASGNQNKLTWVDTNPNADFVIDKTPFFFSFTQVPGYDSPMLYVLGTYHNGGMTLQQPDGAGSDPVFALPQAIPGTTPEISFEVTVPEQPPPNLGKKALLALDLNSPTVGAMDASSGGAASITSSASTSGGTTVDGWAIAFIVLISVLALIALGYGLYMLSRYYMRGSGTTTTTVISSTTLTTPPPTPSMPPPPPAAAVVAVTPAVVAVTPPAAAAVVVTPAAEAPAVVAEEPAAAGGGGRGGRQFLPYGGHRPPPPLYHYASRHGGSLPAIPSSLLTL